MIIGKALQLDGSRIDAHKHRHWFSRRQVVHKLLHLLEQVHLVFDRDGGRVKEQDIYLWRRVQQVVVAEVAWWGRLFLRSQCLLLVFLERRELLRFPVVSEPEIILGQTCYGI